VRVDLPDGNHLSYRYSTTGDLSRVIDWTRDDLI
jgi:hypothetical protein